MLAASDYLISQHSSIRSKGEIIMIKVTDKALASLCGSYQIKTGDLTFLGGGREDSDGIAYSYRANGNKKVLKILAVKKEDRTELKALDERLAFVHFLGTHGIDIAYPEENKGHSFYVTYEDEAYIFFAYSMSFCEGECPKTEQLATDLSYRWGKLMGKAHKVIKAYPIWKNITVRPSEYGYTDEISFFEDWCKDETVKGKWREMNDTLSKLPINRDTYGFIHNDNHQHNIITRDNHITLIDFDCASCHFFLTDIVVPAQGIMFDLSGGIAQPVYNKEPLKRYFDYFLNGYETENHLEDYWLKQIDTFINYRRLLLFTVMQGYLNYNTELKDSMINMIKETPEIFGTL